MVIIRNTRLDRKRLRIRPTSLRVIRDRIEPAASLAMSAMPQKRKQVQSICGCRNRPLWVDGDGLHVIQAPEPEPRIMRYELGDYEWTSI
jgi:hypothetical protein